MKERSLSNLLKKYLKIFRLSCRISYRYMTDGNAYLLQVELTTGNVSGYFGRPSGQFL